MEFSGAFLLGGNVATTIMRGITNPNLFVDSPDVLMLGMFVVVLCVAMWLILATVYGLPVSTTHSCIGGLVGMAVVAKGWSAVYWDQIGLVALSWIITPVTSGLLSSLVFWLVRRFILRSREPFKRGFKSYPYIIALTIGVNLFLVLYKSESLNIPLEWYYILLICVAVAALVALFVQFVILPHNIRKIEREQSKKELELQAQDLVVEVDVVKKVTEVPVTVEKTVTDGEATDPTDPTDSSASEAAEPTLRSTAGSDEDAGSNSAEEKKESRFDHLMEKQNIHAQLEDEKSKVYQMHKNAEVFDERTEKLFTYLQIITAVFNSFAHGANDVANAIGPFAACISIYQTGEASSEATPNTWCLVLGGAGIVVGLACLGYKVMAAIGVNMVKVTPSRGFSIEIASSLVVLFGSAIGLPLSTTHCKVGSTVGVGLVEGKNGVNWSLLYGVFAGWIFTIVICAVSTGLIFAFALYSPKL